MSINVNAGKSQRGAAGKSVRLGNEELQSRRCSVWLVRIKSEEESLIRDHFRSYKYLHGCIWVSEWGSCSWFVLQLWCWFVFCKHLQRTCSSWVKICSWVWSVRPILFMNRWQEQQGKGRNNRREGDKVVKMYTAIQWKSEGKMQRYGFVFLFFFKVVVVVTFTH